MGYATAKKSAYMGFAHGMVENKLSLRKKMKLGMNYMFLEQ
jgi:hypothetical protein